MGILKRACLVFYFLLRLLQVFPCMAKRTGLNSIQTQLAASLLLAYIANALVKHHAETVLTAAVNDCRSGRQRDLRVLW